VAWDEIDNHFLRKDFIIMNKKLVWSSNISFAYRCAKETIERGVACEDDRRTAVSLVQFTTRRPDPASNVSEETTLRSLRQET
jgi:hypothetical protein